MGNCPLVDKFARIGAALLVERQEPGARAWQRVRQITIDVQPHPRGGERFVVRHRPGALENLEVVDLQPRLRHLLLLHRDNEGKNKILCGHDERHWFACTVGREPVKSVLEAMEFLKPEAARYSQRLNGVRAKDWLRRHNAGYLRQGEWFFVPVTEPLNLKSVPIHRNEPLRRNTLGKSHLVEELVRTGGELVYINKRWGRHGLTQAEYASVCASNPKAADAIWNTMRRNPLMIGRGAVRHPDHATIHLDGWHRIHLNREASAGGGPVVWYD